MKTQVILKATFVAATLLALPFARGAPLSQTDYQATKTRISADYKADMGACKSRADNARDICSEEAKGKQKVALAELEFRHSGKPADRTKVMVAQAESAYAVAMEKCDDMAGNVKDVCVKEAKAAETEALADARMRDQIVEAQTDASQTRRDADYGVAIEKCGAMSGDAKASCVTAAKAKFGKN